MPKIAIDKLDFVTDALNDILYNIFGEDVYDSEEIQDNGNEAGTSDFENNTALAMLISNKHFTITIGEQMLKYAFSLIELDNGQTLDTIIYDGVKFNGSVDLKTDINDLQSTELTVGGQRRCVHQGRGRCNSRQRRACGGNSGCG